MSVRKKKIDDEIKRNNSENFPLIRAIEKIFISTRGYVFRMPARGESAILLMSGGLDSVTMASFLLTRFKISLYPLFVYWGQKSIGKERKSVEYFNSYFLRKYGNLFHPLKTITSPIPHPDLKTGDPFVIPLRNSILASHAAHYAHQIESNHGIRIRTIFVNSVVKDGEMCPDATLTAIRTTNLSLCVNENDFTWQYTSLALEKSLGMYKNKDFFINYAVAVKLPLINTWSCSAKNKTHCGTCNSCLHRKEAFLNAGIKDPTVYYRPSLWKIAVRRRYEAIKRSMQHANPDLFNTLKQIKNTYGKK